jgi:TPP-dependent pyruvate/acetoin dehydrogenase alpha subunit
VPAILFCRNNGWAISVPSSTQSATPSFAQKAVAYGMRGVLVDGNDLLAVIHVVAEAAARARRGEGPTLIEARTYRRGAHSTSDDPSVYRDPTEPKAWERRDPIDRVRGYATARGELDAAFEAKAREEINAEIRAALAHAEGRPPKPPLGSLVEDVYAEPTPRLREELAALEAEIAKHGPKRSPHG